MKPLRPTQRGSDPYYPVDTVMRAYLREYERCVESCRKGHVQLAQSRFKDMPPVVFTELYRRIKPHTVRHGYKLDAVGTATERQAFSNRMVVLTGMTYSTLNYRPPHVNLMVKVL